MLKWCIAISLTLSLYTPARSQSAITRTEPADSQLLSSFNRLYFSQEFGFELPEHYSTELYDTIENWLGTPYKFAGNGEKGVDCSGFMNVLFDRVWGIRLGARNSGDIYHMVEKIDPDDLKEGDFVFFSMRKHRISHIGMYLGNNRFVHSSTSKGVIISNLTDPYYKRYFAGAGRRHNQPKNAISQSSME